MLAFKIEIAELLAATDLAKEASLSADDVRKLFSSPPRAEMGDLALPAFPFAKILKKSPPECAGIVKDLLQDALTATGSTCSKVEVAGPYVNFFLRSEVLSTRVLEEVASRSCSDDPKDWHYGESSAGEGKTVVIDLSSPNIAKPLGVHHLRSTMIGNSLKKIYEANGWTAVGVNHLGDWGTSFGKLIAGFSMANEEKMAGLLKGVPSESAVNDVMAGVSVSQLNEAYVNFSKMAKEDPSLEDRGKKEFAALERCLSTSSDSTSTNVITRSHTHSYRNFLLWERIKEISLEEFERVYGMLGVKFVTLSVPAKSTNSVKDMVSREQLKESSFYIGESFYIAGKPYCDDVISTAKEKAVAEVSDGALVMFVNGPDNPPLMLLKDDGATSYHTRDMAAAIYRQRAFGADKALYVVGGEQKLHFQQLFKGLEILGYEWAKECAHIDFGLILSRNEESGSWEKFGNRKGNVVLLHDLLEEAIAAVKSIIAEKNPDLAANEERLNDVALAVGVGAIVFNDLKNSRKSDVKFDWDEMLSFSGETGPYVLYQYVRFGAVIRKFEERYGKHGDYDPKLLIHPAESSLLKSIAAFPETVARACENDEPSVISRYLLDVSSEFSSYWTATKGEGIVGEDKALSSSRIALVKALRKVLGKGLMLLGLRLVDEM